MKNLNKNLVTINKKKFLKEVSQTLFGTGTEWKRLDTKAVEELLDQATVEGLPLEQPGREPTPVKECEHEYEAHRIDYCVNCGYSKNGDAQPKKVEPPDNLGFMGITRGAKKEELFEAVGELKDKINEIIEYLREKEEGGDNE